MPMLVPNSFPCGKELGTQHMHLNSKDKVWCSGIHLQHTSLNKIKYGDVIVVFLSTELCSNTFQHLDKLWMAVEWLLQVVYFWLHVGHNLLHLVILLSIFHVYVLFPTQYFVFHIFVYQNYTHLFHIFACRVSRLKHSRTIYLCLLTVLPIPW